jgi:hypothetical protein
MVTRTAKVHTDRHMVNHVITSNEQQKCCIGIKSHLFTVSNFLSSSLPRYLGGLGFVDVVTAGLADGLCESQTISRYDRSWKLLQLWFSEHTRLARVFSLCIARSAPRDYAQLLGYHRKNARHL